MLSKLLALIVVGAAGIMLATSVYAETSTAQEASTSVTEGTTTTPPTTTTEPAPPPVYMSLSEFREKRVAKKARANSIRRNKGYYPRRFAVPSYAIPPANRAGNLRRWNRQIAKALALPRRCGRTYCVNLGVRLGLSVWVFRNRWDAECVRAHEASYNEWTNPTYDGAWQADDSFESAYGREGMRRWGHMTDSKPDWPPWAQDAMAYRGHQARGWSPWPTYARYCA